MHSLPADSPIGPAADKSPAARHLLLGTAGHIDHGKSSLVRALTGTDPDRLPEEKQRGMTIELGFAHLEAGEFTFGLVDVPGHERFVRTMVAGATAIDMVLLVVASDDSVMPQTREHVDILRLLGVRYGVVALSKRDLVDAETAEMASAEVAELLADTPMAGFPIVPVSSLTGEGLPELRAALRQQAELVPVRPSSTVFRLAVDRVFTVHGRGTVVTGSAVLGSIDVGASLELLPAGRPCRVRGLQTHFTQADSLHVGQRVAINLVGLDKEDLARGDELATPGFLIPASLLHVRIYALTANAAPIKTGLLARLCIGTAEHICRLRLLEAPSVAPGGSALAELRVRSPLAAIWGQRFILRDETDVRTLGGGVVLRPAARRIARGTTEDLAGLRALESSDELERLEECLRYDPACAHDPLAVLRCTGIAPQQFDDRLSELEQAGRLRRIGGQRLYAAGMIRAALERARRWLEAYHARHPDEPGCPTDVFAGWLKRRWGAELGEHLMAELLAGPVRRLGRYCCLEAFAPKLTAEEKRLLDAIAAEYAEAGFQPPVPAALRCLGGAGPDRIRKLMKIAVATGDIIQISPEIFLHRERLEDLKLRLARRITETGGVSVADIRDLTGSTRKFVVPLVEYLDRIGFTQRTGDQRVLAAK